MKNKKKLTITIVGILITVSAIIALINIFNNNYAGGYQKSIYDDNSKIISESDSYSYLDRIDKSTDEKLKLKFTLTGMESVYRFDVKEDEVININYDANISSGKFKVVLVSPEDEVITLLEGSSSDSKDIKINKGENIIKIVGNNAKGTVEISIKSTDNEIIKPISKK